MLSVLVKLARLQVGKSSLHKDNLVDSVAQQADLTAAALADSQLFHRALHQLLSTDVEGCTKDVDRAVQHKSQGNRSFAQADYTAAIHEYSEALVWLANEQQPAEAARIHSNRALCLIKLTAATDAAAPTGGGRGVGSSSTVAAAAAGRVLHDVQQLAFAAVDDCTAALHSCQQELTHKVLYRRAQAQLLLGEHTAAASDCRAALTAAQLCGNRPVTAAAVQDCQNLLQSITAAAAAAEDATSVNQSTCRGSGASLAAGVQEQPSLQPDSGTLQQQEQQQEPSLQQLNQLLVHHQQQAQLFLQQMQQGKVQDATTMLLFQQGAGCQHNPPPQQQCQQQQAPGPPVLLRCCYSPTKGRHLVAAADIPAGTLLLVELPLAAVGLKPAKASQQQQPGYGAGAKAKRRCCWCLQELGLVLWPCVACPLALYCSASCRQAAGSCSSSSIEQQVPKGDFAVSPSAAAAAAAGACWREHTAGGLDCGRPWARLLPEEALLASRCLSAAAAAAAAASIASGPVAAGSSTGSAAPQSSEAPASKQLSRSQLQQQGQASQQQQEQSHPDVLRALLLDSLVSHSLDASASAVAGQGLTGAAAGAGAEAKREPSAAQQQQLVLSCIVSAVHDAAAAATQQPAASKPDTSGQHRSAVAGVTQRAAAAGATAAAASTTSPTVVLRCLQQLVANGIALKPFLSSGPDDRWGFGLYPLTAATVNHDCHPNCSIRFVGRKLLLVCHRGAAAGQELTISYGPQLGQQPTLERQQLLWQQYHFRCDCSSCTEGLLGPGFNRPRDSTPLPAPAAGSEVAGTAQQSCTKQQHVGLQEAAARGLKCCADATSVTTLANKNNNSSSSSSSTTSTVRHTECPGVVIPTLQLPAGLVSVNQPPAEGSSCAKSSSSEVQLAEACTVCGRLMSPGLLQQKLTQLHAAAADAEAACGLMAQHQQQRRQQLSDAERPETSNTSPTQLKQTGVLHRQQGDLQAVLRAVERLQAAAAIRQQHLAPGNQLLGQTHHLAAVAAVEAALLACDLLITTHGSVSLGLTAGSRAAGSGPARSAGLLVSEAAGDMLQHSMVLLGDSLVMQTEVQVCALLLQLQDMLQSLRPRVHSCSCDACQHAVLSPPAMQAVLQMPCRCHQQTVHVGTKQQQGGSGKTQPQDKLCLMQKSLLAAVLHFRSSMDGLTHTQPADSLALAAEQAACCAAGTALLVSTVGGAGDWSTTGAVGCYSDGATGSSGGEQLSKQQTHCAVGCCRCWQLYSLVDELLQQVVSVVKLHLGCAQVWGD